MSKVSEKFKKARSSRPLDPWQMAGSDVDAIARHYNKKREIKIYKNGETKFGQEKIQENQANIRDYETLAKLNNEDTKYVAYIGATGFIYDTHSLHQFIIGEKNNKLLIELVKDYLDNSNCFLRELTDEQITLNRLIADNPEAKRILDPLIEKHREYLVKEAEKKRADTCLTEEQAKEEIKIIQAQLKAGEAVGYMYTNGSKVDRNHFEVLIITSEMIIKPISWYGVFNPFRPTPELAYVRLDTSEILSARPEIPVAQADDKTCGTLGFMYVKELLKDNAQQLRESTLRFPYYDKKGEVRWFFYPSPQTLRYSQSSTYNELIRQMLTDDVGTQTYTRKESYKIETLKGLLTRSIETAQSKGDTRLVEHNTKLLAGLNDFRAKWLAGYDEAMKKRNSQNDSEGNQYLAYSSRRMQAHATPLPETMQNLPIEKLLDALMDYTPEEILDLPLASKVHKQIFESDEFWLLKLRKHFPSAQRGKDQSACDSFWQTYDQQYKDFSPFISKLFSMAKENKLDIKNFPFADIFKEDIFRKDKSGVSLIELIALNRNQPLLNEIYKKFSPRSTQLAWAVDCFQPLDVIRQLAQTTPVPGIKTAFSQAVSFGQLEVAAHLYEANIRELYLHKKDGLIIDNALQEAISADKPEMVEFLLTAIQKDNPEQYKVKLGYVFDEVIKQGNLKLAQWILDRNDQEQKLENRLSKNELDKGCIAAVSFGHLELIKFFQSKGIFQQKAKALAGAAADGRLSMVEYLQSVLSENEHEEARASALGAAAATPSSDGLEVVKHLLNLPGDKKPTQANVSAAIIAAAKVGNDTVVKHLSSLEGDNKPTQASISYALNEAVNQHHWISIRELCELEGDNKPNQLDVSNALEKTARQLYQPGAPETFAYLSALTGDNKPSKSSVTQAFKSLVVGKRWQIASEFCGLPAANKPDVDNETLKTLATHNQFALFKTVYKVRSDRKRDEKLLKDCLHVASHNHASDEFKVWLKNANSPVSYDNLTSPYDEKIEKIRALLDDYTKGDSAVGRFFHGHWNRHHVKKVAEIVKKIDAKEITLDEIITQLKAIEPDNKTGSFAKRKQYILDIIQADMPEEPVENPSMVIK